MTYGLASQDWSRPWHQYKDGYAALAQFASTKCLSEVSLEQHDLAEDLQFRGPEAVAAKIFRRLVERGWNYNLEPWSPNPGQLIRDPSRVGKGSGTCLDLALLFCSMSKFAGLRPYLAIAKAGSFDHAFVVIDTVETLATRRSTPIWTVLGKPTPEYLIVGDDELSVAFSTNDLPESLPTRWLPIDPTDVCRSTAHYPRTHEFIDSVRSAEEIFRQEDGEVVLIDVLGAHAGGYPELDPKPEADRPVIFRRVPTVSEYTRIPSQQKLVEELAEEKGYVILTGEPGAGKSLCASLIAARAAGGAGWVLDAEDPGTLKVELAEAAMSHLGEDPRGLDGNDISTFSATALDILNSAEGRWVVVIDNANLDPAQYDQLPSPNDLQLVLITTTASKPWTEWAVRQPARVETIASLDAEDLSAWEGAEGIQDLPQTPLLLNLAVGLARRDAVPRDRDTASLVEAALSVCSGSSQHAARVLSLTPAVPVEIEHVGLNAAGLAELVDVGLVKMVGQGRAQMHRTLRAEVRKRLAETALDGPVLAQLLRRAESVRYFETAATVAESEQAASIIRDAGLPEETAGECLAVLGSFQARKDTKAAAKWYEMALKLLPPPDDDELSAIQAQLICACLQGVTRAVLRSRIASVSEKRLARERLVAVPGMAAKFPDDPAVQIAASRADAMDGLLRRQIAETVVDPDEQLSALKEALEQLRRSAATRRMWVLEDSPDIDRSLFNISGTLVLVAKAVNDQREVRPLLDEAERAYMEIGRIRARRYRTENLEEVITCVNGRGIVSFYRAILQPELSASERMAAIKMARDHAYRAMMVREGLASRDGLSEDSMKSAKILAKTVVLQHHMAARMNHVKRDAMPDLLKETLVEHERLVVTEVKSW